MRIPNLLSHKHTVAPLAEISESMIIGSDSILNSPNTRVTKHFNRLDIPHSNVGARFSLTNIPPETQEQIGVDLTTLGIWQRVSGISFLNVTDAEDLSGTSMPTILSYDRHGQCVGGFARAASKGESHSSKSKIDLYKSLSTIFSAINLDGHALASEVSESHEEGFRSVDGWVSVLNREIKSALFKEGSRHLALSFNREDLRLQIGAVLVDLTVWAAINKGMLQIENPAISSIALALAGDFLWTLLGLGSKDLRKVYFPSLANIGGIQIDRWLALLYVLWTRDLITKIVPIEAASEDSR